MEGLSVLTFLYCDLTTRSTCFCSLSLLMRLKLTCRSGVLKPGEMSLHHLCTAHGGGPNLGVGRRVGLVSRHKYLVDVVELSSSLRLAVKLLYPHSHWFIHNSNLLTHSVCGGVTHMLATIVGGQVHMLALSHFTHSQSHLFIHSTNQVLTHTPTHSLTKPLMHLPSHSCAGGVTHSTNQALTHRVTQTFNQFALAECDILRESRALSETWRSFWDGSG